MRRYALCALLLPLSLSRAHADLLGTAASFAVLAGSTATNTGPTTIGGDLGVSPGTAVTGFPPGIVSGTIHQADAVAGKAQNDLSTVYHTLAGLPFNEDLTGQDLGGLALLPGVYFFCQLGGADRHADAQRSRQRQCVVGFRNRAYAHHGEQLSRPDN